LTESPSLDVLVVEDDGLNLAVVLRLLERTGHRPSAVTDGRSAVLAIQRHRYDVVLMDIEMPELDGIETTKAIRALGSDVRIIALTGHAGPEHGVRCRDAGMEAVLVKPIDARRLDGALRRTRPTPSGVIQGLPIVDLDAVVTRLGGDVELVLEVSEMVREEAPKLLRQLVQYVNGELGDACVLTAHSLKGALSNLNARATHTALRIEQLARRGDWQAVRALLGDLEREMVELDAELPLAMSRLTPVKSGAAVPLHQEEHINAATDHDRGRFSNRPATGR
jgi:CheY-like chemotaxis protein